MGKIKIKQIEWHKIDYVNQHYSMFDGKTTEIRGKIDGKTIATIIVVENKYEHGIHQPDSVLIYIPNTMPGGSEYVWGKTVIERIDKAKKIAQDFVDKIAMKYIDHEETEENKNE